MTAGGRIGEMKMALRKIIRGRLRLAARALLGASCAVTICVAGALLGAVSAPSTAQAQTAQERGVSGGAVRSATGNSAARKKQRKSAANSNVKARPASAKPAPRGFIETITAGPRLTTTPPEAADWVRASRATQAAPRGSRGPERAVLTADQIRANEAQMDALRARHDRAAGRKPLPGKPGSAAGKPEAAEAEKYEPGCALTCATSISVSRSQRK